MVAWQMVGFLSFPLIRTRLCYSRLPGISAEGMRAEGDAMAVGWD